jgi:folate-dependent phosphoribosylglycinamide formyltransferase PurN
MMVDVLDRPIRVVLFGSGPQLNRDVEEFLLRLDEHPEIELLAVICQASSRSWFGVVKDLWKRRGILALPLLISRLLGNARQALRRSRHDSARRHRLARLAGRITYVKDIHAPVVIDQVRKLGADLGLIYGSPLLKPSLFNVPRLGTLGIHHGKLPEYRGNKTTFWAMYNGEQRAGVTIQKVNRGLDTGEIVSEGTVPAADRSYAAVVHDLEALGLDLYIEAILQVKRGTAIPRPQLGPKGRLYLNPTSRDFIIFGVRQFRRWISRISARSPQRARGAGG